MSGPLEGIKVVEIGVWVAGPAAGGILADWGADVIKIEPPGVGDPARRADGCQVPGRLHTAAEAPEAEHEHARPAERFGRERVCDAGLAAARHRGPDPAGAGGGGGAGGAGGAGEGGETGGVGEAGGAR